MGVDNSTPHYATLPHSLWEAVLQRVDVPSLASFAACSRETNELASGDLVWKHAYQVGAFGAVLALESVA